jgi:hypothetical protein
MSAGRRALLLALAGSLVTVGCQPATLRTPEADRVVWRIEHGGHRLGVSPITLISTPKKLYGIGEDIRVTVRVVAPPEARVLDEYLPATGRFYVRRDGALADLKPPPSSARLAWVEVPIDLRRHRERNFTITVNRIFPMRRGGWYAVRWEGTCFNGRMKLRSGAAHVRVMRRPPK